YVRRVAEQEAAPLPEARGGPMMDAVGGEPAAALERSLRPGLHAQRWDHLVEGEVVAAPQLRRQYADNPPVVRSPHGKEQVESLPQQVDVQFVRHHGPG